TIPIVIIASTDPVAAGLVKSLARPGTNVTGMSNLLLTAKHVELLTEIVPKLSRIVLIIDATNPNREIYERVAREAAAIKKLTLLAINATPSPEGIRAAFVQAGDQRGTGVVMGSTGPLYVVRSTIVQEVSRMRATAVYGDARYVEAGGLISYGANLTESYRKEVPPFMDRILKGANPAEMPVQQSARFEMVINLKAAKQLGLTIPQTVLFRADRVIE
ncbi:MAG: ABC transporter substrate-binding protein, partial [Burkholderiales bacterium]